MLAFLVMLRDALVVLALSWVGVTLEQRDPQQGCVSEACQADER